MWFVYALGSAVFAALTSILAKIGIEGVNSTLATAIRTAVVLLMSWGMVFLTGTQTGIAEISRRSWLFLVLSGLATGASWLCYYHALQVGAASKVVPIDKAQRGHHSCAGLCGAARALYRQKPHRLCPHHRRYTVYGAVTRYAKRLLHFLCSSRFIIFSPRLFSAGPVLASARCSRW